MPTYTNNHTASYFLKNYFGLGVSVEPGESIETRQFYTLTGLTKTADTPLFNMTSKQTQKTSLSATPVELVLQTDTKYILFVNISDECTVTPQASDAEPMLYLGTVDTPSILYDVEHDYPCESIFITGSGSVIVHEMVEQTFRDK